MKNIILLFCFLFSSTTLTFSQTKNFIDQPYVDVTGYADTMVTPNLIYIKILISEKDSKGKIPVADQECKMTDAFKIMGLNIEQDLTTSDMLSSYKTYFLRGKDILQTKEYIMKVTTAEMAFKAFQQLEELGNSNTSIYKLDHTEMNTIKNSCRTKAVENARQKASLLAGQLSQKIGNAIFIGDNEENKEIKPLEDLERLQLLEARGFYEKTKFNESKTEFNKIKISSEINVKFKLI